MARYGANELFNPGGGRRKKKRDLSEVIRGSSSGSLGPMPHSQAPDALAMLNTALSLGEKAFGKDDIKPEVDKGKVEKNELGQKSGGGASQGYTNGKKKKKEKSLFSFY